MRSLNVLLAFLLFIGLIVGTVHPASADPHADQSINVAIIGSTTVINGGVFPTTTSSTTGSFTDFRFFSLNPATVSLAALEAGGACGAALCDTVLLNVASPGMNCNINVLNPGQKADLVNFVALGRKLIIYDSECPPQDYSWLPFPFATSNPGQLGAQGTLTIVEENTLSSANPANPHYINAPMLATSSDAVGDMNVMITFDPNWALDMSGTNALGFSGPVHTYAKYPSGADHGLIIYNGLDVDYLRSSTIPETSTAAGNLARLWLMELQEPFNPSGLPGGVPVVGIALAPPTSSLEVGQSHTVTARLTDLLGLPQPGLFVTFHVTNGPNAGVTGVCSPNTDCSTDAKGWTMFTYNGVGGVGVDTIKACFTNVANVEVCSAEVHVEWEITMSPIIHYYGLGDSIAAGHGLMPSVTDDESPDCRRSRVAYPRLVMQELEKRYEVVDGHHLACSGATVSEPDWVDSKEPYKWLRNQVDDVVKELEGIPVIEPVLVSISIGANDFKWADGANFAQRMYLSNDSQFEKWRDSVIDRVTDEKKGLPVELNRLITYPNVVVVLNELYNPMNTDSIFFKSPLSAERCGVWDCRARVDDTIDTFNAALRQLWLDMGQSPKLQIAGVRSAFRGHESASPSCGGAAPDVFDTYILYKDDLSSNSYPDIPAYIALGPWYGDCFHPNIWGHEAIAELVNAEALEAGR